MKLAVICWGALFTAACGGSDRFTVLAKGPGPSPQTCANGTRWSVLLDLSGSLADHQRKAWVASVAQNVAPRLRACDQVLVLPVHEASSTVAPLMVASISGAESLREKIELLKVLDSVRRQLISTVETAAQGKGGASGTDLFGALDRLPHDRRPAVVLIASDMLHVSDDFRVDRVILKGHIPGIVREVLLRRGWNGQRFANTKIAALLPETRGITPGVNDRKTLQEFWDALARATGASLVSFETYVPAGAF